MTMNHPVIADLGTWGDPVQESSVVKALAGAGQAAPPGRPDNTTGRGAKGHWTRGRGQKFSVPMGRKTNYGSNGGDGDTDRDGL